MLERDLEPSNLPKHIGVMVDGNRRWAQLQGFDKVGHGHAAGAKKIVDFLTWCSVCLIDDLTASKSRSRVSVIGAQSHQ